MGKKLIHRLILAFSLVVLLGVVPVVLLYQHEFQKALINRSLEQLQSINILKKQHITAFFDSKMERLRIKSILLHHPSTDKTSLIEEIIKNDTNLINVGVISKKDSVYWYSEKNQSNYINPNTSVSEFFSENGTLCLKFLYRNQNNDGVVFIEKMTHVLNILKERTGMGKTGETYIVGDGNKMKSPSRFFPNKNPNEITVKTLGVINAKEYDSTGIFNDYRNVKVLSAYSQLKYHDLSWVILSEIDHSEAITPISSTTNKLLLITIGLVFIIILLGVFFSRYISTPITRLKNIVQQLSIGDLTISKREKNSIHEINIFEEALGKLVKSLIQTSEFAQKIGEGNFDEPYSPMSDKDALGSSLIQMQQKLKSLNTRTEELSKLSKKALIKGQENERIRLAKELHDGIGPLLTSIKIGIQNAEMSESSKNDLKKLIDQTIKELRVISNNLMPSVLLDFGVHAALQSMIDQLKKHVNCDFSYFYEGPEESNINDELGINIYRIAQEAVNNSLKHSQATRIAVSLTVFEDHISLFIKDNGHGFDFDSFKQKIPKTNGLRNMEERAALFGGNLYIQSEEEGTSIEVIFPI